MTGYASIIVCRVLGHRWKGVGQIDRRCLRCGKTETFLDKVTR